jgi:hypothetical protein
VADLGRWAGFEGPEIVEMPANNLSYFAAALWRAIDEGVENMSDESKRRS